MISLLDLVLIFFAMIFALLAIITIPILIIGQIRENIDRTGKWHG